MKIMMEGVITIMRKKIEMEVKIFWKQRVKRTAAVAAVQAASVHIRAQVSLWIIIETIGGRRKRRR